ncbi:MAG: hypothetical protein ABR958_05070 [Dehalococcoidales bacterium]
MPAVAHRHPAVDSQAPPAQSPDIPWFAPRYIRFTYEQMIFLLIHLPMLRAGHYPPDPKNSGYVDSPVVQTGIQRTSAYFTKSAELAAEIDSRLTRCGLDRYLVEDYYCRSIPEEDLARHLDIEVPKIRRCIKSAVSYISSGPCPRWLNCLDCGKYQSCHYKKHVGTTYKNWKRNRRKTLSEKAPAKESLPAPSLACQAG